MSGICGAWALDGGDPALGPVLAGLERRGPDGTRSWSDGAVALGHTLLATTPEALVEQLPLTEPDSGCTITADVRLDNCEELIGALGLDGETRTIGDGELILRAYLKWGEGCPTHLLGDFAFAIWDRRGKRLFCARDHMGMRQLIYHHAPGRLFAFATEADALVAHVNVPKRINEARIADYLDNLEGLDFTSTFFEELYRLPPAHTLTIDVDGLSVRRFWELKPGPELQLDSDQAYADAFLKVFTEAVRCRLRSAGPVGSMLSGGVDSNSVGAIAARLLDADSQPRLQTFSARGPNPELCAETRAILVSVQAVQFASTTICHSKLADSFAELIQLTQESSEPFDGNMTLVRAVYLAARRRGINTMLDGAGGDMVLTADNRVAALLRQGRIWKAIREVREERQLWGSNYKFFREFLASAWAAFAPIRLRAFRRQLIWRHKSRASDPNCKLIADDFARAIDLEGRRAHFLEHLGEARPIGANHRVRSMRHPHLVVGRERYNRVASALAIEPRDPFLDIRVVQFCLSLPPSQLQVGGRRKLVLRRAMEGRVPFEVLWRHGKEHLGWSFTKTVFAQWLERTPTRTILQSGLERFVSLATLLKASGENGREVDREREFELRVLGEWLARIENAVGSSRVTENDDA